MAFESVITGFAVDSASSILALGLAILVILVLFVIAVYIYSGLAFMAIGRRAGVRSPGLSWIPFIGPMIISFKASKMSAWPWLLLLTIPLLFIPILIIIVIPAILLFVVYAFIWDWKMFEAVNRQGWWTLMRLIPFVGGIVYLILVGIAAWGNPQK